MASHDPLKSQIAHTGHETDGGKNDTALQQPTRAGTVDSGRIVIHVGGVHELVLITHTAVS
jgi:hypothetical protein